MVDSQTPYPTLKESAERYAVLWNKWNCHEVEARDVLIQLEREGCFMEAVCKDWAKTIERSYDEVLKINIENFKRFQSSPTSTKGEEE